MNACEYCGETFPNITELYRHKHSMHKKSLLLHNQLGFNVATDGESDRKLVTYNPKKSKSKDMEVIPYDQKPFLESDSDVDFYGKRKRKDSNVEDEHRVKRYKKESVQKITPRAKDRKAIPKIEAAKRFDKLNEEILTMDAKEQVIPVNVETNDIMSQVVQAETRNDMENHKQMLGSDRQVEIIDYKVKYERCLAELKAQAEKIKQEIFKIKKECRHDIMKIKKKFKKRELALKKDLAIQKKHNIENMTQIETFHSKKISILKEKIKSMERDSASFKPL